MATVRDLLPQCKGGDVRILVVQDNEDLGRIWCRFLARSGLVADLSLSREDALNALKDTSYDALVIEPAMPDGGGIPVADFATYRNPEIAIIAVTKSTFFSDGSIFGLIPNARGFLRTPVRPADLVAYLEYCASRASQKVNNTASAI